MNKLILPAFLLISALVFAGCGSNHIADETAAVAIEDTPPSADVARITALEARIAQLELSHKRVETELSKTEAELAEIRGKPSETTNETRNAVAVRDLLTSGVELDRIIAAKIEERIGTTDQIESIFTQAVQEGMEDYERRKQEEARRRAEERRQAEQRRREEREQRRLDEIAQTLELTSFETEQLRDARVGVREAVHELFRVVREGRGSYNRDQVRAAMTEIRSGHESVLSEFLSEEQVEKYKQMEGNRMPFWFSGGRRRSGSGR